MFTFMSKEKIELIHDYAVRSHQIFGQFIYGKFLDSLIIGIIAFIGLRYFKSKILPNSCCLYFDYEYDSLFLDHLSVGFPAVLVALMTGDLFHALAVLVLSLLYNNLMVYSWDQRFLGDVVGISPFWVLLFYYRLWTFLWLYWNVPRVPMICVIRMLFNDIIDFRNKMKELDT